MYSRVYIILVSAMFKCMKWMHDTIYYKQYKMATSSSWNAYLEHIKKEAPLAARIYNILIFIRFAEVPAELLVRRFLGLEEKYIFVAIVEGAKYYYPLT